MGRDRAAWRIPDGYVSLLDIVYIYMYDYVYIYNYIYIYIYNYNQLYIYIYMCYGGPGLYVSS